MNKRAVILTCSTLIFLATAVFGTRVVRSWQKSANAKRTQGWLQTAINELKSRSAPSNEAILEANTNGWVTSNHLIFSNDWATYKIHTFHESDDLGDINLLRGPDGTLYLSHFHFCVGIYGEIPAEDGRPKDFKEFLAHYGTQQNWKLLEGKK